MTVFTTVAVDSQVLIAQNATMTSVRSTKRRLYISRARAAPRSFRVVSEIMERMLYVRAQGQIQMSTTHIFRANSLSIYREGMPKQSGMSTTIVRLP